MKGSWLAFSRPDLFACEAGNSEDRGSKEDVFGVMKFIHFFQGNGCTHIVQLLCLYQFNRELNCCSSMLSRVSDASSKKFGERIRHDAKGII